jgi:hypothetical protein
LYTAMLTTVLTIITFAIAFFTPPLSGPLCTDSCFTYPFIGIEARFPRDYFWMYPALVVMIFYTVLMACIHQDAPQDKKLYGVLGLGFAFVSTTILLIDYFLQISIVQPSLLQGEVDGIALWSQFNSHGIFIALEELGYLIMSLSLAFAAFVFGGSALERSIRWIFLGNFALNIASLIGFSVAYGIHREYLFEITTISLNWLTLIIAGILLTLVFKRASHVLSNAG